MSEGGLQFKGDLHPEFLAGKTPLTFDEVKMNKMLTGLSSKQLSRAIAYGIAYKGRRPENFQIVLNGLKAKVFFYSFMWWRQFV